MTDRRLSIQSGGRRFEFLVDSSPLTDSGSNHVGYLLLFQDISEEVQRKEQLAVLNRVLRHNLRNKLTVARGYIDVATDANQSDPLRKADEALANLRNTSEQAREVEQGLGGERERESVELRPLLEDLVAAVSPTGSGPTVNVDAPAVTIRTNGALLRAVVGQLLENAIEHTATETVDITVEQERDGLSIAVADDGPGIPDHELQVLETGEETALEHGSGLGLWLIKWSADRLGGEISFETDQSGTRGVLTLPTAVIETGDAAGAAPGKNERSASTD